MTKIEKFIKLVKEKFDLDLDPNTFRRTYAGYWQRGVGAWSWWMCSYTHPGDIGSRWSITELLKHKDTIKFDGEEFFIH